MIRPLALLLLTALCSTTPPAPTITAAEAAKRPGQQVRVRATVARVYVSYNGYTFLNLDKPRPGCRLEVAISPDLIHSMSTQLQKKPTSLVGRVVVVSGVVQAAEGSTAQIWLSKPADFSVAP